MAGGQWPPPGNRYGGGGNARGSAGPKKKSSAWISNKELKKMTAGAAPPIVEKIYDHGEQLDPQLFWAWEGEKAAPPIWHDRPIYKNLDLSGTIAKWRNDVPVEPKPFGPLFDPDSRNKRAPHRTSTPIDQDPKNLSFHVNKSTVPGGRVYFVPPDQQRDKPMVDLVPRAWIPEVLEPGQTLQSLWHDQVNAQLRPQDESDLTDTKPFWELYLSPYTGAQLLPTQPHLLGCDTTEDTPQDTELREKDRGSQGWINQYLQNPNAFMKARFGRKATPGPGRERSVRYDAPPQSEKASLVAREPTIDHTLKPELNLFIRMAELSDIPQITAIYNHYIKNSVCTPELDCVTIEDMRDRLESVRRTHLPFIVCCSLRGYGGSKRHKDRPPGDTVLGYAFADDLCGPRTALRFTTEMGLFVSPKWTRKGVSKCLMDKLMGLLDQYYAERGGYDVCANLGLGTQRLVSRIMLNFMNCPDDHECEWMIPYLESWGFELKHNIEDIGYKLGKK